MIKGVICRLKSKEYYRYWCSCHLFEVVELIFIMGFYHMF